MPTSVPQTVFQLPLAASAFPAQTDNLFLVDPRMRFENIVDYRFDRLGLCREVAINEAGAFLELKPEVLAGDQAAFEALQRQFAESI